MSSTLNRLRKLFNDPIMTRDGRRLVATPLAESMAEPVRDILNEIENVLGQRNEFDLTSAEQNFPSSPTTI